MKNKSYKYKLISSVLVMSFIATPLFTIPTKTQAQSVSGYIGGLTPIIAKLPQCQAVIGNRIKGLFGSIGGIIGGVFSGNIDNTKEAKKYFSEEEIKKFGITDEDVKKAKELDNELENTLDYDAIAKKNAKHLEEEATKEIAIIDSVKVNISNTPEGQAIQEINEKTTKIDKSTSSMNENSTCIQSIGRLVIKMVLQKTTVSMINWINSGFDGKPAFVQDFGKFFGDIAKNEILQFGVEINDPEHFPFAKAWLKNFTSTYERKFRDNAEYSLDRLIKNTTPEYSADGFLVDFSQGGWNAWLALTQNPGNNPWDFKVNADNEIQRRLTGTSLSYAENVRQALQAADGFLGDERCVEPRGITRTQHNEALARGKKDSSGNIIGACEKWEYVTPGKLVSEAATNAFNYPQNAWLNVEDLNDAIAAIIDSLINKFYPDLVEKGFAYFDDTEIGGRLMTDSGYSEGPYRSRTEQDFAPIHLTNSWLSDNPEFNIRTDLTQALIDEQRTYIDKLSAQNKELLSTTDGQPYKMDPKTGTSNAYGLLPVIYQLDYCIPGPHPGWETDARNNLASVMNLIIPETQESLKNRSKEAIVGGIQSLGSLIITVAVGSAVTGALGGAAAGSVVPVIGTAIGAIVGATFAFVVGWVKSDPQEKVRLYYSAQLATLTGYLPDYDNKNDDRVGNVSSKSGMTNVLNTVLERYIDIMNKTYFSSPDILPSSTKEAASNFNLSRGYLRMIDNNNAQITSLQITINSLNDIKKEVDALNDKLALAQDTDSREYEKELKNYEASLESQINAFGRLSANMVNGNDISKVDNLTKQIIDKKEYIYKNLLKGPYGCEADLMKPQKSFPSSDPSDTWVFKDSLSKDWDNFNVNTVKRMTYPAQILYDYNVFNKSAALPNPAEEQNIALTGVEKDDFINRKMPSENEYDTYGPGFLSFVLFSTEESSSRAERGPERLKMHDLIPQDRNEGSRYRALGDRKPIPMPTGETGRGIFEYTISIY